MRFARFFEGAGFAAGAPRSGWAGLGSAFPGDAGAFTLPADAGAFSFAAARAFP